MMDRPASARALCASLAVVGLLGLSACGSDDPAPPPETSAAEDLCRDYRDAVTEVRTKGLPADKTEDFAALAAATDAAIAGTDPEDLTTGGDDYLATLETLAEAYRQASEASERESKDDYFAALDVAEPADDMLDGLAGDGGLASCALGEVESDEQGVSQSGYPALALPADATPVPPGENTVTYSLPEGSIRLIDVQSLPEGGTVPPEEAATAFEETFSETFSSLEPVGDSGNELVPMTEYSYEFEDGSEIVPGITHVFSGQGELWALDCSSGESGEIPDTVQAACDRAVETLGFLIF